jgi:hypothetical protein
MRVERSFCVGGAKSNLLRTVCQTRAKPQNAGFHDGGPFGGGIHNTFILVLTMGANDTIRLICLALILTDSIAQRVDEATIKQC